MNSLPSAGISHPSSHPGLPFAIRNLLSARVWLPLILLAAFALRLYRLGIASLWYDETVSVFLAQKDLLALTRHTAGDIHPPLYYYLLHFWGQLAGWSEFAMAFLSLFFGVLLIALTYRVAREWFDQRVGVVAALLVALSPYNLWYSQEVRMYTLGATLGLASTFLFVRLISQQSTVNSQQSRRILIAYALISALGMYTLYYFAFLLVFQNLAALVWFIRAQTAIRHSPFAIRAWLASQFSTVLLFASWLPIAFRQATDPPVPPWRSLIALPTAFAEAFSALVFGQSLDASLTWLLLLLLAALIVFTLITDRQPPTADDGTHNPPFAIRFTAAWFLLGYTFVPLAIIYALSLWKPLYHVRYVFTYSPAFYILLAVGIARLSAMNIEWRKYAISLLLGALVFGAAVVYSDYNFWFEPRYAKDDLRGAVHYLSEHWRPGDAILINAGYTYTAFVVYFDQPVAWRGRVTEYPPSNISLGTIQRLVDQRAAPIVLQTGSIGGSASLGWGSAESDFYATTADATRAALDRVFAAHERVWMLRLYDTVVDPDGVVRDYLATRGRIIDDQGFAGESFARVQGYITRRTGLRELPTRATRREILLGNRIALLAFEPATTIVRAGEPLDVTIYWRAQEPTNVDARMFVGLFAADGTLVASSDELPIGNALGTSRWTPGEILREPIRVRVPAKTAPGDYTLRVALYDPRTNEPLDAPPGKWVAENGQVVLTNVRVTNQ
ncbi:MAG: glycosyltransferase family 39 protein [Chloroflexi bacterium]|nr:glycosyltransferase family 39 protein [Chloroflexota bacterium]